MDLAPVGIYFNALKKRMLTYKCLKCSYCLSIFIPRSTQGSRVVPIITQMTLHFFAKLLEMIRCNCMHVYIEHSFSTTINQVFVQFYSMLIAPPPNVLNVQLLIGQTWQLALECRSCERAKQERTFIPSGKKINAKDTLKRERYKTSIHIY